MRGGSMEGRFDAIVVGAGIVGLCAAAALARQHLSVLLLGPAVAPFKADDTQAYDPRVYAISNKSQRFLSQLKAWDAMAPGRLTPVMGMDICGDDTREQPLTLRAHDSGLDALTWIVEQQNLLDALEQVVRFSPGLVRVEQHVQSMQRNEHLWTLTTADGQTWSAPRVLAADGANSAVRAAALLDFPVEDYNAHGVVATFEQAKDHDGIARQWFLGNSVLALLPLPGRHVSMVWSMDTHQWYAHQQQPPQAWAQQVMQAADGRVAACVGDLHPRGGVQAYPLRHGLAPLWFADGAVLLGDAAHLVHPLAGQGLNIGIEDVADFQGVAQAGFSDAALRAWQRQRKAEAQPIHWLTHGLNGLFRVDLPGAQWLRNTGMQVINQVPAIKRWLIGQAMR